MLVCLASQAVPETNRLHVPMWKLHEGSRQWIERLRDRPQTAEIVEFDVEDCFLNTPRSLVTRALSLWVSFSFGRGRRVQFIPICKNSHKEDHAGRPCSSHFWELSVPTICAVVEWEMEHNSDFEVASSPGMDVVLRQVKGLPIGCHLSAALVELTALFCEQTTARPSPMEGRITARYRDNFFVAVDEGDQTFNVQQCAVSLTALLQMPVKLEGRGSHVRCLELRIRLLPGLPVHAVLAFRTDADRQGESGDVESWPPREDPRARLLVPGLLSGLAAKMRLYRAPGTRGFTASVRNAVAFVRRRGCPYDWWVRRLANALVRNGVPIACLPRLLRAACIGATVRN